MNRRFQLVTTLHLLFFAMTTGAATPASSSGLGGVSIDYSASYVSKYMWRGFDLQENAPAFQPDVFISLGETGLYAGFFYSAAMSDRSMWGVWDEIDAYCGYAALLGGGSRFATGYDIGFTHYYFPRQNRDADTQEVALALTLPDLIVLGGSALVPRVKVHYGWSPSGPAPDGLWVGVAALYESPMPSFITPLNDKTLSWKVESYYNDGAQGFQVEPGWSSIMAGVGMTVDWLAFTCTPEINYQYSMEDTVDPDNEFWFTVSFGGTIR